MQRILVVVGLFFLSFSVVQAEEVLLLESKIGINPDGSLLVTETINYDFGTLFKHGIFRDLRKKHPQEPSVWYKKRQIEYDIQDVAMDGEAVPYDVSQTFDNVRIKIGDPDTKITGQHTYEIVYIITGGLSYYEAGDVELYLNVTGNQWEVPIRRATAIVASVEEGVLTSRRFCYSGEAGATNSCPDIRSGTTTVAFSATLLSPGHELTIAQDLSEGKVGKQVIETTPWYFAWALGGGIWLSILAWFVWRYRTEFKPYHTVVSQYEPFEDFRPMFTGVLFDARLDSRDITAGLLYLAEQGFLHIKKTSDKVLLFIEVDDYEVTLKRSVDEVDSKFLQEVLLLLFDTYDAVGKTVRLSELKRDSSKKRANTKIIQKLRNDVVQDLVERGYFEQLFTGQHMIIGAIIGGFVFVFGASMLAKFFGGAVVPVIVIVIATAIIFGSAYQRRTRKGYAARNHLKGFKEFLSVTEKERYEFHNAPEKSPEQFMQFLPYAVAFGVEKKWAEVFKDITIASPAWYDGDGEAFSATALTSDIGAFSSSFTQSSGTSASSGGGSAGGGAGGGGGGSW